MFFVGFGYHLAPFWLDFGLRGVPGEPLGTLCGTPVAQVTQKCDFWFIWDSLGPPFGTLLGSFFGSGPPLEALGVHFGSIFALCGRLSVSMSILDPKNS